MNDLTKTDDDNLAEVIRYFEGHPDVYAESHIQSLKKFREAYHRYLEGKGEI